MAENHMAEVAKILGVELGEEFEIKGISNAKYLIDSDGIAIVSQKIEHYRPHLLQGILTGKREIVRRPWRPKVGDEYWRLHIYADGDHDAANYNYCGDSADINFVLMGNCFPTREAAEAAAPEIVKFYKDVKRMVEE